MRHLTKITQGLCKSVFTTTHPYIGRGDTWRTMTAPLAFTEVDDHILTGELERKIYPFTVDTSTAL